MIRIKSFILINTLQDYSIIINGLLGLDLNNTTIIFFGGEPLLYKDAIFKISKEVSKQIRSSQDLQRSLLDMESFLITLLITIR